MPYQPNKRVYITLWYNEIEDITAKLISEVWKDVRIGLSLLKLNGEEKTEQRTAKKNNKVRLDFNARGFWVVFELNPQRVLPPKQKWKTRYCN